MGDAILAYGDLVDAFTRSLIEMAGFKLTTSSDLKSSPGTFIHWGHRKTIAAPMPKARST